MTKGRGPGHNRSRLPDGLSQLAADERPAGENPQDIFYKQAVLSDMDFCSKMLQAIADKLEDAPIGVFVDSRPFAPTARFYPADRGSGVSSPAQECAEMGGGGLV